MPNFSIGNALVFFFIFIFLLAIEVVMDVFLLPADEVLVPGEIIMDVLLFSVMVYSALSGSKSNAVQKVRQ
jgi:hypothetical protein